MSTEEDSGAGEPHGLGELYRRHFRDPRRERQLLSSLGFFAAFAAARAVTHAQRARRRPRRAALLDRLRPGRHHHHHLVLGILLLLATGYAWLLQLGTGVGRSSRAGSRLAAALYGVGAALTLDEFALWLDLEDVYWAREGRQSIDAVVLFGALLSVGGWGAPFFRALINRLGR